MLASLTAEEPGRSSSGSSRSTSFSRAIAVDPCFKRLLHRVALWEEGAAGCAV
jgi:hypothetical protein